MATLDPENTLNTPEDPTLASDPSSPSPQEDQGPDPKTKKRWSDFKTRVDACKVYRRKLVSNWTYNIDMRRGKPFSSQTDEDRVNVNLDWSLTKAKQASLFSQVPDVHIDHSPQTFSLGPWVYAFEQRLNDTLITAGIEAAMDECLPDCINAAGVAAILCSHEAITEDVEVPAIDMSSYPPGTTTLPDGSPVPTTTVPNVVDHRYLTSRVSPADFLWPINFTGSDFDTAPWIGRSGRITWAQAVSLYNLSEADKDSILGEDRTSMDRLTHDIDKDKVNADEMVGFDEIFYKEFQFDSEAKSYTTIHHLVYLQGKDDPVVDEPWKGQKIEGNQVLGAQKYPIRVLTLTYITDEAIPPSDSAIGRPQVNEINKSRTQMILQRERSLPIRWFDVNRVDPTIQQSLMRGTWQAMIPVQGQGTNIIGEVAKANMPPENFTFDKVAKSDLSEAWQVGPDQLSGTGESIETKGEATISQSNYQTRIGRERAKVASFFVSVAQVLGGLLCLYEDPSSFGQGFDPAVSRTLSYSILADSTVLLDSNQRLQKLINFFNFAAKTGWVDISLILKEISTLSGLDPNSAIKPPMPKPPVEPNISLRLTGTEDMMNPLTLAFLMKSGQAPPSELIEQAKALIQAAVTPPPGMAPPTPGMPGAPLPMMPGGPGPAGPGAPPEPLPPGVTPPPPPPPPLPPGVHPPAIHPPLPPPPAVGEANQHMNLMPRVNRRAQSGKE